MNNNRIMVKATTTERCVCLRTISWAKKSPFQFYIPRKDLLRLRQETYLVVNDLYSFAEIYRRPGARVQIRFYWLSEQGCTGSMQGWKQEVMLPMGQLLDFAERGGWENGPEMWKLLSIEDTFCPRFVFTDTRNLRKAVENPTVRRKLARFLSRNFHYCNATEIRLSDDYLPYSFFFQEMVGDMVGLCGGVILHGQEDLATAQYSIHT